MATISAATNEKVYSIPKWLGLNENPDGETRLKVGEAGEMVNWKITRDGNLKRRPGTEFIAGLRFAGYEISTSAIATTFQPYAGTDELTIYAIAECSTNPGQVALSGTSDTYTLADFYDSQSLWSDSDKFYLWFDELAYMVKKGSFGKAGDVYSVDAYRITAVPVTPNTRAVMGMWSGMVGTHEVMLAGCDGKLWSLYDDTTDTLGRDLVGTMNTDKGVFFIPFDGKVYILNGYEYYQYDGTNLTAVDGYMPLVAITIGPLDTDSDEDTVNDTASNPGELTGEYVNRLTGKRRVWLSPDGTNGTFQLPEKDLYAISKVIDLTTGNEVTGTWTGTPSTGQIAFSTIPAKAVNSLEVQYEAKTYQNSGGTYTNYRSQVTGNLFAELFSGTTDTRIFIYGDGTNRTIYSGMDYDGMPRADYFPDQYEARIGDSNTPITAMIRHYSSLICYKPNECWAIQHGIVELATSDLTPAIYSQPVNRDIGNVAPGQVRLVNNNPISLCGHEAYSWSNSSYYTSNLSRDERQARRISDRIQASIKELDLSKAMTWDDNDGQEYYISENGITLVYNYAQDVWYRYEGISPACMCNLHGELYIGTADGKVLWLTYEAAGDEGELVRATWRSGAMDFGANNMRKFSSMLWVGIKPEEGTSVDVTLMTDRKDTFRTKAVPSDRARVDGAPFMTRIKLKAKKFVYYYIGLGQLEKQPAATVTDVAIRVRTTGYAR